MAAETGATTTAAAPGGPAPNPLISFMPILVVCAILYLLVIRPQQKQTKEHKRMIDNLKSGDRVLTQGGLFGTVSSFKGPAIVLKIADNVKVEVSRGAITQVIVDAANGSPNPTKEVAG